MNHIKTQKDFFFAVFLIFSSSECQQIKKNNHKMKNGILFLSCNGVFFCASGHHPWRHYVSILSDRPYVCSILVNTITQKHLQGIFSHLGQTSTGIQQQAD